MNSGDALRQKLLPDTSPARTDVAADKSAASAAVAAQQDGPSRAHPLVAAFYCAFNIVVASMIVFANKWVFQHYNFKFVFALTWVHTIFTWLGMIVLAQVGFFIPKRIPDMKLIPIALGYVGYIVLCNVSLNLNSVGFYQIMKIAIAPTVVVMEFFMFNKLPTRLMLCSVLVVCAGITIATVSDSVAVNNMLGLAVGVAATLVTALYQIWAGSKQRELQANSSQLLHAYTPHAVWLLGCLVPIFEPMGWTTRAPGTLLGYQFTWDAVLAIVISAVLGILVSLSTFLVIGTTSSLTYNIVGHLKTVIILTGGVMMFGDAMPLKRFAGICVAMLGIAWYTQLLSTQSSSSPAAKPIISIQGDKTKSGAVQDSVLRHAFVGSVTASQLHQLQLDRGASNNLLCHVDRAVPAIY